MEKQEELRFSLEEFWNGTWIDKKIKWYQDKVNAYQKVDANLSAWNLKTDVPEVRKELRKRFIEHWKGQTKVWDVNVPELSLVHSVRGLEYVEPAKLFEMSDEKDGITVSNLTSYVEFCDALHSLELAKYYKTNQQERYVWQMGLPLKEQKYFSKMIKTNQEEKISLLSKKQYKQYRADFIDVCKWLPSARFDKYPEAIGLAAVDPLWLMANVKKQGVVKTAQAVDIWFDAERKKIMPMDMDDLEANLIMAGAIGFGLFGGPAIFKPDAPVAVRGVLGAVAAVSGWLALHQLWRYYRKRPKVIDDQLKQNSMTAALLKYRPRT